MGVVIRQSVKTSIVTLTGALLGVLIQYLYTRKLSTAEVGSVAFILRVGAVLQFVLLMGGAQVLFSFFTKTQNAQRRKAIVGLCMAVPLLACLVLLVPYIIFQIEIVNFFKTEDRPFINEFYYYIPPFALFWSYFTLFEIYLMSQIKVALTAFIKEVALRVLNLILLGLLWFGFINFGQFIISLILIQLLGALSVFYISTRTEDFGVSANWGMFKRKDFTEMASFGWYHLLSGVSLYVLGYLDTFLLGIWVGLETLAPYIMAILIVTFMVIPYRIMASTAISVINKAYIDKDQVKLTDLFQRSGINILIVSIALFILIICNLHNATALLGQGYETVAPICIILMVGRLIDMATGLNSELIGISHLYKFNFRISIILVTLLVLFYYLLVPKYGVFGAAWGSTLSLAIFNVIKLFYLWRKMNLHPFSHKTSYVLIGGIIAGLIGYFIPAISLVAGNKAIHTLSIFTDVAVRSLMIIIIYVALLFSLRASPDLNDYLRNIVKNKRLF